MRLLRSTACGLTTALALVASGPAVAGSAETERAASEVAVRVRALTHATLTADRAVQIALLSNRNLRATFEEIGVAQADLLEAGLLKNPSFEGSVRFPNEGPTGTNNEVSIALDFIDALQLPLRRKVAASELARAELRASDAVLKLATEVKTAFYTLQANSQIAARLAEISRANVAALELYRRQHDAGNISDLDLAQQKAVYAQASLEAAELETEIQSEREKLNRLMGLWGSATQWRSAEHLPDLPTQSVDLEHLETRAIKERRDLAATQAEIAGLVQNLGLTRTYRLVPSLELGLSSEVEPDGVRVTGPKVRMELPAFNQGQARVAKLQAQLRQAESRLEAEAIDIRAEVREARNRMVAKQERAKFYRTELLPGMKRVLDLSLTHYNAMLKGPFDLLLARQNELAAERGYVEALRDYWIARADLERAVGGSLTSRVRASSGSFKETKTQTQP